MSSVLKFIYLFDDSLVFQYGLIVIVNNKKVQIVLHDNSSLRSNKSLKQKICPVYILL